MAETKKASRWRAAARKALDTWAPSLETSVAEAIERGYIEGIVFSAKAADTKRTARTRARTPRLSENLTVASRGVYLPFLRVNRREGTLEA